MMEYKVKEGSYNEMGVSIKGAEVVFTFCGEKEDACYLLLTDRKTKETARIFVPSEYCLGSLRSVAVELKKPEQYLYEYEINGKPVADPYARVIVGREVWNDASRAESDYKVYSAIRKDEWGVEEHHSPEIAKSDMVMYKLHVRGFSMDHGSPRRLAGTFCAVTEKIDYLKALGVTTVEFMPIYEFEEMPIPVKREIPDYIRWEASPEDLIRMEEERPQPDGRLNYWGYTTGSYFAVKASYGKKPERAAQEFKSLVESLHANGMECVMEMFFPEKINQNLILDALRYWVRNFHVDGFHLIGTNLPITAIVQDVILSRTKIFCTGYEESALAHSGKYKNLYIYKEEYQYPARKILNHINADMVEFINQQKKQGTDVGYVNYISSNNGFTLADVFMYNDRHNEANGENNADGDPWNFSTNYGAEGATKRRYVLQTRHRQWRNAVLMLFLAQGVPLLWGGDEFLNSQQGNNNAYCQDNAIGWMNWKNAKTHAADVEFVQNAAKFRREHSVLSADKPFFFSDYKTKGFPDVSCHGENAWLLGIDVGRMNLGLMYCGAYADKEEPDLYVGYNFYSARSTLALPKLDKKKKWYLAIDTAREKDPFIMDMVPAENQQTIALHPQSICVLIGK